MKHFSLFIFVIFILPFIFREKPAMSVMNFGHIRDLVSNLVWKENENTYAFGTDCLGEKIVILSIFFSFIYTISPPPSKKNFLFNTF